MNGESSAGRSPLFVAEARGYKIPYMKTRFCPTKLQKVQISAFFL
jgi:hypothetical protein